MGELLVYLSLLKGENDEGNIGNNHSTFFNETKFNPDYIIFFISFQI